MLKYITGMLSGVLLGAIAYATLEAYIACSSPEAYQKYTEAVQAAAK